MKVLTEQKSLIHKNLPVTQLFVTKKLQQYNIFLKLSITAWNIFKK